MDRYEVLRRDDRGRFRTGHIVCAHCGLVGHTMGKCPDRPTAATTVPAMPRVVDVPRRCSVCTAPTIHTVDGRILDDRPGKREHEHEHVTAAAA